MPLKSRHKKLNFSRSLLCTIGFYVWAIIIGCVMIATIFLLPKSLFKWLVITWAKGNHIILHLVAGITFEVRGRENIPLEPAIIASKHQSEWETTVFLLLLDNPVYVIKKELGFIPGYGQFTKKMGMISIDRLGHARALRYLIKQAKKSINDNRSLIIFPEGTRVMPGTKIRYQSGVAGIYSNLDVSVVPVIHNSGMHWPPRSFRKYPGKIILQFLPAIEPGLNREKFMFRLENTMEEAMSDLLTEVEQKN
tara:strand:+ start:30354 stop:31106 length:753 start_codon:yes stop_codon:yes gene_type:complete